MGWIHRSSLSGHPPTPKAVRETAYAIQEHRINSSPPTIPPTIPYISQNYVLKLRSRFHKSNQSLHGLWTPHGSRLHLLSSQHHGLPSRELYLTDITTNLVTYSTWTRQGRLWATHSPHGLSLSYTRQTRIHLGRSLLKPRRLNRQGVSG